MALCRWSSICVPNFRFENVSWTICKSGEMTTGKRSAPLCPLEQNQTISKLKTTAVYPTSSVAHRLKAFALGSLVRCTVLSIKVRVDEKYRVSRVNRHVVKLMTQSEIINTVLLTYRNLWMLRRARNHLVKSTSLKIFHLPK